MKCSTTYDWCETPTSNADATETRQSRETDEVNAAQAAPERNEDSGANAAKRGSFAHAARVTTGVVLLPVGVALLVLPGPGLPLIATSLALLRTEFRWADSAWNKLGDVAQRGLARLRAGHAS
jgi:Putative transmembrane protein (PGPGW)